MTVTAKPNEAQHRFMSVIAADGGESTRAMHTVSGWKVINDCVAAGWVEHMPHPDGGNRVGGHRLLAAGYKANGWTPGEPVTPQVTPAIARVIEVYRKAVNEGVLDHYRTQVQQDAVHAGWLVGIDVWPWYAPTSSGLRAIGVDEVTGHRVEILVTGKQGACYVYDRDGEIVKATAGPHAEAEAWAYIDGIRAEQATDEQPIHLHTGFGVDGNARCGEEVTDTTLTATNIDKVTCRGCRTSYAVYVAELTAELGKFSRREAPYEQEPAGGSRRAGMDAEDAAVVAEHLADTLPVHYARDAREGDTACGEPVATLPGQLVTDLADVSCPACRDRLEVAHLMRAGLTREQAEARVSANTEAAEIEEAEADDIDAARAAVVAGAAHQNCGTACGHCNLFPTTVDRSEDEPTPARPQPSEVPARDLLTLVRTVERCARADRFPDGDHRRDAAGRVLAATIAEIERRVEVLRRAADYTGDSCLRAVLDLFDGRDATVPVKETPSAFEGAPPVRTFIDGSRTFGPYITKT